MVAEAISELPSLPEFNVSLKKHRGDRSAVDLGHEAGIDSSYITRMERCDRPPPRISIVESLTRSCRLDLKDGIVFYLSAGFAHPALVNTYTWIEALDAELSIFNNQEIPLEKKDQFVDVLGILIDNWESGNPTDEKLPEPPGFPFVLRSFRENAGRSRNNLSLAIGYNESYLYSAENRKRFIPSRAAIESIIKVLKLDSVEAMRLLLTVGYAPRDFITVYPFIDIIVDTVRLFNDQSISVSSKSDLSTTVAIIARNWQETAP